MSDQTQAFKVHDSASLSEVTDAQVAAYLDEPETDDTSIGNIEACVRIISKYAPGDADRDSNLVGAAFQSICEWAQDFGVMPTGAILVED